MDELKISVDLIVDDKDEFLRVGMRKSVNPKSKCIIDKCLWLNDVYFYYGGEEYMCDIFPMADGRYYVECYIARTYTDNDKIIYTKDLDKRVYKKDIFGIGGDTEIVRFSV